MMITKEICEKEIKKHGYVCTHCGGELKAIETYDNTGNPTHWSGCDVCNVFNYGTTREIYNIAAKLVDERFFVKYESINKEDDPVYWRKAQINGAVTIVSDVLKLYKEGK